MCKYCQVFLIETNAPLTSLEMRTNWVIVWRWFFFKECVCRTGTLPWIHAARMQWGGSDCRCSRPASWWCRGCRWEIPAPGSRTADKGGKRWVQRKLKKKKKPVLWSQLNSHVRHCGHQLCDARRVYTCSETSGIPGKRIMHPDHLSSPLYLVSRRAGLIFVSAAPPQTTPAMSRARLRHSIQSLRRILICCLQVEYQTNICLE